MKILILPGYSSKNKVWADEVQKNIKDSYVCEWKHWKDVNIKFSVKNEVHDIKKIVGERQVNIIAKSIGTLVAAALVKEIKFKKIILCGIPIADLNEDDLHQYSSFSDIDPLAIIVFQNSEDEHGSFEEVRRFLSQINPNIKIVEKPGSTHDYPYLDEFIELLG